MKLRSNAASYEVTLLSTCFGERQMHSGGQSRLLVVVFSKSEVYVKSTAAMHSR